MGLRHGAVFVLWAAAFGDGWGATLEKPQFFVNWEAGQIEEAHPVDPNNMRVDKEIVHHAGVWTLQEARLSDRARFLLGVGGAYFFVFPRAPIASDPNVNSKRSAFGLTNAFGEFNLIDGSTEEDHLLLLKAGIFEYQYNPDAKNLGEYMYRTWYLSDHRLHRRPGAGEPHRGTTIGYFPGHQKRNLQQRPSGHPANRTCAHLRDQRRGPRHHEARHPDLGRRVHVRQFLPPGRECSRKPCGRNKW